MLWADAVQIGLPVFPLGADKRPLCSHGFKDAQTDRQRIHDLFAECPNAELIGVPTGEISGFDALDLDTTRHAEAKEWLRLTQLPQTRIHQTKSGGCHYLFRHREGVRNWTARPVLGVDGRGDGGYIVWWPQAGFAVNSAPPVDWPADLLKAVNPAKPAIIHPPEKTEPLNDSKLAGVLRSIAFASNGTRNDLLFWGACRAAEWITAGEIQRSYAERMLTVAAQRAGLDAIETGRTIASAFKTGSDRANTSD